MSESTVVAKQLSRHTILVRGESLVAIGGIASAAILLATIGFSAWWSMQAERDAWRFVRNEQIRSLAHVLSQSAESMLAGNELSGLRRLLIDARHQHELTQCSIVLPDGKVIADADPSKITLLKSPDVWPRGPVDAVFDLADPSAQKDLSIAISQPLLVPGKGRAVLRIAAPVVLRPTQLWQTSTGIGLMGAAALAALLIVYRRLRARVLTLGLIRESLLAGQGGAAGLDTLELHGTLGPEAAAWNQLLEENRSLRQASVAERVKGSATARNQGRNDLEHVCDALPVGMIVLDDKAMIKHANGAAAILLQTRRDGIVGQQIGQVMQDPMITESVAAIVCGSGQRRMLEIRRGEAGGEGILRVHLRPLRREDGGGALITIEDITQQRVADAARNSFVAQATHELRMPLTNMRLCLETALEEKQVDANGVIEHFNVMNLEVRRLERMVGEMLSVAEIEAGSLRLRSDDVQLRKVCEELEADYKAKAVENGITLNFELPPKLPVIHGDRDKLMITLHNLLGNAMKYTPAGGKVTVTVRADASRLTVDVADSGIGVQPEEQQKIFEKFYRAKDARLEKIPGTGLGLALAREIARLHGGDITVQSELNKGSTFSLTMPLTQPAAAA